MTAYELADAIEDVCSDWKDLIIPKATSMLRQQADRIAELEKAHPVKQLSDKEIREIAKDFMDIDYTLDDEEPFDVFDHLGFARAIIKEITE